MKPSLKNVRETLQAHLNYCQQFVDALDSHETEELQEYWSNLMPELYQFYKDMGLDLFTSILDDSLRQDVKSINGYLGVLNTLILLEQTHESRLLLEKQYIAFYLVVLSNGRRVSALSRNARDSQLQMVEAREKSLGKKTNNPERKAFERIKSSLIKQFEIIIPRSNPYVEASDQLLAYIVTLFPEFENFIKLDFSTESDHSSQLYNKFNFERLIQNTQESWMSLFDTFKSLAVGSKKDEIKDKVNSFWTKLNELKSENAKISKNINVFQSKDIALENNLYYLWDFYKKLTGLNSRIEDCNKELKDHIRGYNIARLEAERIKREEDRAFKLVSLSDDSRSASPVLVGSFSEGYSDASISSGAASPSAPSPIPDVMFSNEDDDNNASEQDEYVKASNELFNVFRHKKQQQQKTLKRTVSSAGSSSSTSSTSSTEDADLEDKNDALAKIARDMEICKEEFISLFGNDLKKKFTIKDLEYMLKRAGAHVDNSREGCRKRIKLKNQATDLMAAEIKETLHGKHDSDKSEKFLSVHSVKDYRAIFVRAGITPEKLWPVQPRNISVPH